MNTMRPSIDRKARLARLDKLADTLDSRYSIAGIRFGWDSILGLIPGVGDVATLLPGAYIVAEAARMGVRKRVLGRMGLNSGLDFLIGGIPVLGDAFDVFFKANRRNIALLKREAARLDLAEESLQQPGKDTTWQNESDPTMASARPRKRSSAREARSAKAAAQAVRSNATLPRRTS